MHVCRFEQVLVVALSVGNYMNSNTSRANCNGVYVKALLKMVDVKSGNKKVPLMAVLSGKSLGHCAGALTGCVLFPSQMFIP